MIPGTLFEIVNMKVLNVKAAKEFKNFKTEPLPEICSIFTPLLSSSFTSTSPIHQLSPLQSKANTQITIPHLLLKRPLTVSTFNLSRETTMAGSDAERGKASGQYHYNERDFADEEREWRPWLVPTFIVANIAVFVAVMYVNNCPAHPNPNGSCLAGFLHRFSFEPLKQNPLIGPSSST